MGSLGARCRACGGGGGGGGLRALDAGNAMLEVCSVLALRGPTDAGADVDVTCAVSFSSSHLLTHTLTLSHTQNSLTLSQTLPALAGVRASPPRICSMPTSAAWTRSRAACATLRRCRRLACWAAWWPSATRAGTRRAGWGRRSSPARCEAARVLEAAGACLCACCACCGAVRVRVRAHAHACVLRGVRRGCAQAGKADDVARQARQLPAVHHHPSCLPVSGCAL